MSLFSYRTPKARLGELTETLTESPRGEGSLAHAGPLPRASASCRLGHPGRGASCPSTVDITVPQPLPPLSPGVSALHQLCGPQCSHDPNVQSDPPGPRSAPAPGDLGHVQSPCAQSPIWGGVVGPVAWLS